jgi:hypothetical protein
MLGSFGWVAAQLGAPFSQLASHRDSDADRFHSADRTDLASGFQN